MAKRARRWFPNQHSCHATSKKCKKDTKSVPISGRCCWSGRAGSGRVGSGRVGPGRANRAFEDPNWSTQNGRLLWGSVLKNVREIAAEPVPITLGEFRRSLRSLCFLPRRFAPRGASRRFANLITSPSCMIAVMYSSQSWPGPRLARRSGRFRNRAWRDSHVSCPKNSLVVGMTKSSLIPTTGEFFQLSQHWPSFRSTPDEKDRHPFHNSSKHFRNSPAGGHWDNGSWELGRGNLDQLKLAAMISRFPPAGEFLRMCFGAPSPHRPSNQRAPGSGARYCTLR